MARKVKRKRKPVGVEKAKMILEEGEVMGRPLSEKQKAFFGFIAGGGTPTRTK